MAEEQIKLTPQLLAATDPAFWTHMSRIMVNGTEYSFKHHEYQLEWMQSRARRKCLMKATQTGGTLREMLCKLHGLIYGRYPQGVLYLFPTTDDVGEFSKSRFKPLIDDNPLTIGKFVKAGGKGTDTTSLKKVGSGFLYMRGARMTQAVGTGVDAKESTKLRSIPVDCIVLDETDLMDEDVIAKAKGRMGHSKIQEEVYLSNPTLPDFGIDKLFHQGDQRHWFRRCGCGEWTCAELSFPDCVHIDKTGRGYIACKKCGANVGPSNPLPDDWNRPGKRLAEWVPAKPENSTQMASYRDSQLMSIYNDPAEILRDYQNPPQGNLGDVYRLRLGLPYVAAEDKLTPEVVLECCGNDLMLASHPGQCAMGVDVGKIKHVVIGIRTGNERFEILKTVQLSAWSDIHDLARRFNVKSAVIDARPYEDEARSFQKSENYRIFLCEYSENTVLGTTYNDTTGLVKVNRTEVFDATHRLFSQKLIKIPRRCPDVDEFAAQCCNTAKVLETNKRTGTSIYRYRKMGDEHYRNALNYFYLAASGSKIAQAGGARPSRQNERAIMEYAEVG